ncbi:MAG TPA: O-antigen ligase family protein [Solirubrobacteraceae bacterium]|nr:O-antigen ligase family protein [Solirubrobacteraceae bacterium]
MPHVYNNRRAAALAALLGLLGLGAVGALAAHLGLTETAKYGFVFMGALAVGAGAYLIWHTEPHYTFTFAVLLAPFAGNWQQLGVSGELAPERLILLAGLATVLLRGPGIRNRPPLRLEGVHWLLALVAVYAVISALFAGTLFEKAPGIELIETFGIFPFLVFTVAPVVFPTARERATLVVGLVGLATYLSLTTIFEITGPSSLVFPSYISDPSYGIHFGYGRGPFVEAVSNGFGLYVGALACFIAVKIWHGPWARRYAAVVGVLCLVGSLLTFERSVWISTVVASLVLLLTARSTRRIVIPALVAGAVLVAVALVLIPGLSSKVSTRAGDRQTVWDRQNLDNTALNMINAHPLFGFGWSRYLAESGPYVQLSPNIPLTASNKDVHSIVLTYAVELGLVGVTLWIIAVLLGVAGALLTRAPPDLEPWRATLLALFVFFAIQENFVPPAVFQNLCLWLWVGVVWAARYPQRKRCPHE